MNEKKQIDFIHSMCSTERPKALKWFGNMSVFSDFLNKKSWLSGWLPIKIIDCYLRALGVVVFACNPFSGALIFAGIFVGNRLIALTSFVSAVIGIATCKLIKAPNLDVCSGVAVFNSILLGSVVPAVFTIVFSVPYGWQFWIYLSIGAFIVVFVDQGLQSLMAPSRLPVQSVPFNLTAILMMLIFRSKFVGFGMLDTEYMNQPFEINMNISGEVDWIKVFEGTAMSTGQIYGIESLRGSLLIWLGYLIYSPILAFMLYLGAVIGAVAAVLFQVAPVEEIYIGLWSYNSMLAGGAIGFFVVPTLLAVLTGMVNALLAAAVQTAITPLFMQTTMPVFSYPFNTAVMLILAISLRKESPLQFVENKTFPEEHLCKQLNICGSSNQEYEVSETETIEPLSIREKFDV